MRAISYQVNGQQYVPIAADGVATADHIGQRRHDLGISLNGSRNGRLQPFAAPQPPATEVAFTGPPTASSNVQIVDYAFGTSNITVRAGSTVTWRNTGSTTHIDPNGGTASIEFDTPGTYVYTCFAHPFILGQIVETAKP